MAVEAVFNYLVDTNRPYSATDITLNLRKEYGKTVIQKALDELVASNRIYEKVYGKQKVYCVLQREDSPNEDLSTIEEELKRKQSELASLESTYKECEKRLKELLSQPSTEIASLENSQLLNENKILAERLEALENGGIELISVEEREKIKKNYSVAQTKYKTYKRTCIDILNAILESYPKSKAELYDDIGIETDP